MNLQRFEALTQLWLLKCLAVRHKWEYNDVVNLIGEDWDIDDPWNKKDTDEIKGSFAEKEKRMILDALIKSEYIQKDAAELLNISARRMFYKIVKYNITYPTWKKNR